VTSGARPCVSAPAHNLPGMTFANVGTLGTLPGRRDELVALLTARNDALVEVGCLAYEVGTGDDPDTVYVVELWESADAHRASLGLPEVQAAIAAARPLLDGTFGGFRFDVVGSPLRE
jgi:quinol monooxygenase YgiN